MLRYILYGLFTLMLGCTDPSNILLGSEPLKQIGEQGELFSKLPEEDRKLLVAYLTTIEMGKTLNAATPIATGKTVKEVLIDAQKWKVDLDANAVIEKQKEEEVVKLRNKILEEQKAITNKINQSVTVAITSKRISKNDYSELLMLTYAIENKTDKVIRQLNGRIIFKDLVGDVIGELPVVIKEIIKPAQILNTDTGSGWRINKYRNKIIEHIAYEDFDTMHANFLPTAIAFDDGETLIAPTLTDP